MTNVGPGHDRTGPVPPPDGLRAGRRDELVARVLSAVVMAVLALGTAWTGGLVFDLFWLVAAIIVLTEWHGLVGATRRLAAVVPGIVALGAAQIYSSQAHPAEAIGTLALGAAATLPLADAGRRLITAGGVFYAGALVVALPILRHSAVDGIVVVLWLFAIVWGTDTMAFFGGRLIGGPKLAPRLSPSKTWSGFIVGITSGAVLGLMVTPRSGCGGCIVVAGLLGGALAQAGDLFESSLKRRFGVKDAGSLIPGHGGLMDRLDGFIAASIYAATVGLWRFGAMESGAGLLKW